MAARSFLLLISLSKLVSCSLRGLYTSVDQKEERELDKFWHRVNTSIRDLIEGESRFDEKLDRLRDAYHNANGWHSSEPLPNEANGSEVARHFSKIQSLRSSLELALGEAHGMEEHFLVLLKNVHDRALEYDKMLEEMPEKLYQTSENEGIIEQLHTLFARVKESKEKHKRLSPSIRDLRKVSEEFLKEHDSVLQEWRYKAIAVILQRIEEKLDWVDRRVVSYKKDYAGGVSDARVAVSLYQQMAGLDKDQRPDQESLDNYAKARNAAIETVNHLLHEIGFKQDDLSNKLSSSWEYTNSEAELINDSIDPLKTQQLREWIKKVGQRINSSKSTLTNLKDIVSKLRAELFDLSPTKHITHSAQTFTPQKNRTQEFGFEPSGVLKLANYLNTIKLPQNATPPQQPLPPLQQDFQVKNAQHLHARKWKTYTAILFRLFVLAIVVVLLVLALIAYATLSRKLDQSYAPTIDSHHHANTKSNRQASFATTAASELSLHASDY